MKPADRAPGGEPRKRGHENGAGLCPLCRRPTAHTYRPFCSKRCADIDLGRWLRGGYALPGAPAADGERPFVEE